jgi:hypothetical protein
LRNHTSGGLADFIRSRDEVTHVEMDDGRVLLRIGREADVQPVRASV